MDLTPEGEEVAYTYKPHPPGGRCPSSSCTRRRRNRYTHHRLLHPRRPLLHPAPSTKDMSAPCQHPAAPSTKATRTPQSCTARTNLKACGSHGTVQGTAYVSGSHSSERIGAMPALSRLASTVQLYGTASCSTMSASVPCQQAHAHLVTSYTIACTIAFGRATRVGLPEAHVVHAISTRRVHRAVRPVIS